MFYLKNRDKPRWVNLLIESRSETGSKSIDKKHTQHSGAHLLGAALEHHILLALVQPPLPHGPEVEHSVLSLQQLIQDI